MDARRKQHPKDCSFEHGGPGLLIVFGYIFWASYGAEKIDQTF